MTDYLSLISLIAAVGAAYLAFRAIEGTRVTTLRREARMLALDDEVAMLRQDMSVVQAEIELLHKRVLPATVKTTPKKKSSGVVSRNSNVS